MAIKAILSPVDIKTKIGITSDSSEVTGFLTNLEKIVSDTIERYTGWVYRANDQTVYEYFDGFVDSIHPKYYSIVDSSSISIDVRDPNSLDWTYRSLTHGTDYILTDSGKIINILTKYYGTYNVRLTINALGYGYSYIGGPKTPPDWLKQLGLNLAHFLFNEYGFPNNNSSININTYSKNIFNIASVIGTGGDQHEYMTNDTYKRIFDEIRSHRRYPR